MFASVNDLIVFQLFSAVAAITGSEGIAQHHTVPLKIYRDNSVGAGFPRPGASITRLGRGKGRPYVRISDLVSTTLRLAAQRPVQPLNRLVNLGVALEADDHRVDEAAFDCMLDGLLAVFGPGEIAVAAELHGDDAAPFGVHRLDLLHRLVVFAMRVVNVRQVLIYVMALRVDAGELDFHPIARRRGAQRAQPVAGTAFGVDPLFSLRLVEGVHQELEVFDPGLFRRAVDQQAVEVVRAEFLSITINRRHRVFRRLVPDRQLCLDEDFVARDFVDLDRLADHLVGFVIVGGVNVANPALVGVGDEFVEAFLPEVALHLAVDRACAHAQSGNFDSGFAPQRHPIAGRARGGRGFGGREHFDADDRGAGQLGRLADEFAATDILL